MEWAIPVVSVLASAAGGLVTIYVARKKGLPDINKEVEQRLTKLVNTMRTQLEAESERVEGLSKAFAECKGSLTEALAENDRLTRRLRLAEADLLTLYRGQGRRPPTRLTDTEIDDD